MMTPDQPGLRHVGVVGLDRPESGVSPAPNEIGVHHIADHLREPEAIAAALAEFCFDGYDCILLANAGLSLDTLLPVVAPTAVLIFSDQASLDGICRWAEREGRFTVAGAVFLPRSTGRLQ